jgi:tyrosyl-tRNA synthetase
MPLITRADGGKFGKTEAGTVWLDPRRTSPYSFYQFWLAVADADVYRFLRYFTFLPVSDIAAIEAADKERAGRPEAQRILAEEVTRLVHGEDGLAAARRITDSLFSGDASALGQADLEQLRQDGLPSGELKAAELPETLTQLLSDCGLAGSGKQVKDALQRNAVFVNGVAWGMDANGRPGEVFAPEAALHGRFYLVRLGKKKYHLFERAAP